MNYYLMMISFLIFSCKSSVNLESEDATSSKNEFSYRSGTKVTFSNNGDGYPLISAEPSQICNDITFYNANGDLVTGTRDCGDSDEGQTAGAVTAADCSSEGEVGCVTTESFKPIAINGLAAKVLAGQSVAGVSGTATISVCEHSNQSQCEADSACQWSGGACSVNTWNIRQGITISGADGKMKPNCRNQANSSLFNTDATPPPTAAATDGTAVDWWDTINHSNGNADSLPTERPSAWSDQHSCGNELWLDVTPDGACDSAADDCMMKDQMTGLVWSESYPITNTAPAATTADWSAAVAVCHNLSYGGRDDWRLPTHAELTNAYAHAIRELGFKGGGVTRPGGDSLQNNDFFISDTDIDYWSATARSWTAQSAWFVNLGTGNVTHNLRTTLRGFICVAP